MQSSPARAFRLSLILLTPLLLCRCSSFGPSVAVEGELASPESSLPRSEYPFDESGRYREDWVSPPSKKRSASRTRNATSSVSPKPTVTPASSPAAAPSPAILVSNSAPRVDRSGSHQVRNGDTLWSISRRYGVNVADLKAANGMRGDTIHPGEILRLP
ncbi:MAG: LysM repeat-containing protein [Verrucomicrobia bacterium]|jgi:hypothetical protein|nr:MAG: LysM repeat-containing protein [Verrucomicrobiota bacterium]